MKAPTAVATVVTGQSVYHDVSYLLSFTINHLYTDTQCNKKISYNDNLTDINGHSEMFKSISEQLLHLQ